MHYIACNPFAQQKWFLSNDIFNLGSNPKNMFLSIILLYTRILTNHISHMTFSISLIGIFQRCVKSLNPGQSNITLQDYTLVSKSHVTFSANCILLSAVFNNHSLLEICFETKVHFVQKCKITLCFVSAGPRLVSDLRLRLHR